MKLDHRPADSPSRFWVGSERALERLRLQRRKVYLIALLAGIVAGVWFTVHQLRQTRLDTALLAAIRREDTSAALTLLDEGADANATEWIGRAESPSSTLLEVFGYWLHGRRPPNRGFEAPALYLVYTARYRTPMRGGRQAAAGGNSSSSHLLAPPPPQKAKVAPLVKALLDHGADPNYYPGRSGPLDLAVHMGDAEAVRLLLDHHANPNVSGQADVLPLMSADPVCARLLIEHGANIDARNQLGLTPLMMAAAEPGGSAAERAALLLEHGADPNLHDAYGQTALMHAVSVDAARLLLRHGAEIDAETTEGRTALMMECANYCDPTLPRFLIRQGASVSRRDRFGRSARDYALQRHRMDLCALLAKTEETERAEGTDGR